MTKAQLLHRSKLVYPDGAIREMIIWRIPEPTAERPHSLKYRLYYGDATGVCLVRYDNEMGKGDHKHLGGQEIPYTFTTVERLVADFQNDIDNCRRTL